MAKYRNRVRIVKGRDGRLRYYKGDGLSFFRIGEDKAIHGLKTGAYKLWDRTVPKPKRESQAAALIRRRGW